MASLNYASTAYNDSRAAAAEQANDAAPQEAFIFKLLLLVALAYFVWSDKVLILSEPFSSPENPEHSGGQRVSAAVYDFPLTPKKEQKKMPEVQVALPAGALTNVTFAIDYAYAKRNGIDKKEVETRLIKCREYAEKYAPVAMSEMRKTGVPASVTLAQALLESNAGESKLATKTNNHFGIKCFSKRCKRGHCANFTDDSHKDFFVKYADTKGSFRAHSQFLLKGNRYRQLFEFESTDYRNWSRGLGKAGYATDKKYGDKLIAIIQTLGLDRYDKA
jgi:flagellum-specific peptidoglycan hydrolase FlgJ